MATKTAARPRDRDRAPAAPKPKSDAYVGMLALALLAQIAGAVFLWLDYSTYGDKAPPKVQDRPPAAAGPKQPEPPPPGPAPGPGPMPAPMMPPMGMPE